MSVEKLQKLDELEELNRQMRRTEKSIKRAELGMAVASRMMWASYGWFLAHLYGL